MISFDEFITKWTEKPVDFDGVYPNQCMDLMHQYVYEVLGITDKTVLAASAAYQVFTNFRWPDLFTKITNTPTGVPDKGDIVLFGQTIGAWGHVCIAISGDTKRFSSFDANWPVGSLPHVQEHTYTGVLGWLKPRPAENYKDKYEKLVLEYGKLETELETLKTTLTSTQDKYSTELASKIEMIEMLQKSASELTQQLVSTSQVLTDAQTEVKSLTEARTALEDQLSDSVIKIQDLDTKISKLEAKVKNGLSSYSKWELFQALFLRR